jgi:hypothetical protein
MADIDPEKEFVARKRIDTNTREVAIAEQNVYLLQEKLAHCFRVNGVNHGIMCKELREEYVNLMKDPYRGQLFPENGQPPNRTHPFIMKS